MSDIENLIKNLSDENSEKKLAAIKDLGSMGESAGKAACFLAALLDDIWVQKSAFWALCQMRNSLKNCVIELSDKLNSEDDFARISASSLIGDCSREAIAYIPLLKKLSEEDPNAEVRINSKEAIFKINPDAEI